MSLLDCEAKRLFRYPEELALAMVADSQGLGGIRARLPGQVKAFSPKSSREGIVFLETKRLKSRPFCFEPPQVQDRGTGQLEGFLAGAEALAGDVTVALSNRGRPSETKT